MLAEDPATAFSVLGGLLAVLLVLIAVLRRGTEPTRRQVDDEYVPLDRRDLGAGMSAMAALGQSRNDLAAPEARQPGLGPDLSTSAIPGLGLDYTPASGSQPGAAPQGHVRNEPVMATGLLGGSMTAGDPGGDGTDRNG